MVKYALVHIYGLPGTEMTHSKPTKMYGSIKEVRVAAMRMHNVKNAPRWIVRLNSDNSATIIGQVFKYKGQWEYNERPGFGMLEKRYVLNKDGSLGKRL